MVALPAPRPVMIAGLVSVALPEHRPVIIAGLYSTTAPKIEAVGRGSTPKAHAKA